MQLGRDLFNKKMKCLVEWNTKTYLLKMYRRKGSQTEQNINPHVKHKNPSESSAQAEFQNYLHLQFVRSKSFFDVSSWNKYPTSLLRFAWHA